MQEGARGAGAEAQDGEHGRDAQHKGYGVRHTTAEVQLLRIGVGREDADVNRYQRKYAGREEREEARRKCGGNGSNIHEATF